MRRIFVITASNEEEAEEFINIISRKIYNITYFNYYTDILGKLLQPLGIDPRDKKMKGRYKLLNTIENIWTNINKQSLYDAVLQQIENRDSPKSIIFVLSNNRHILNKIKTTYTKKKYGIHVVRSVKIVTGEVNNFVHTNLPIIDKTDIKLTIPSLQNKALKNRIINQFINTHIPIKHINWINTKNNEINI